MQYQEYSTQYDALKDKRDQINSGLKTKKVAEITNEQELEELIATAQVILRLVPSVPSKFANDYNGKVDMLNRYIYHFNQLIEELKGQRTSV